MTCSHCGIAYFPGIEQSEELTLKSWHHETSFSIFNSKCPECHEPNMYLRHVARPDMFDRYSTDYRIWPINNKRHASFPDVPQIYLTDYFEACLVLELSPKASAALSRRCLQSILTNHFRIDKRQLVDQITSAIEQKLVSPLIAEQLNYLREIGNFAVHEIKSTHTKEIIDVEPNEAEWCIEVLEAIFIDVFQAPAEIKKKRSEFDRKITDAGRDPLS